MNENEFYFEKSIKKEWIELFNKKGVTDCIPYLRACQNRIFFAIYDLNAYYYAKDEWAKCQEEMSQLLQERNTINDSFFYESRIIYCGTEIDYGDFLQKINFTFFNSLHSFFDIYGKLLSKILNLNEDSSRYFQDVVNQLKNKAKYNSIVNTMLSYIEDDKNKFKYKYINDLDNTNKHNEDILINSTLFINDGLLEAEIQGFERKNKKETNNYSIENMNFKLDDILEFVVNFYNDVTNEVIKYIS